MTACAGCLRRAWLVQRLGARLEIARHEEARLPEVLALADPDLIAALAGRDAAQVGTEHAAFDDAAARAATADAGLIAVCRHDERYPARLSEMRDAPAVLHVGGELERMERLGEVEERVVAIVGTRRASRDGLEVARALGRDLALAGVPVVSGMALGIDAAAQRGAVDAGGLSVAVLAGGADVPYPRRERALHAALLRTGLVVSEAPAGGRAWKWAFPARNRTIAGLADLTVVVEAAERSGSLITADLALRLGRDVAAVPGPVTSPICAGTNALLRDGATLVRGVDDVLDALYGAGAAPQRDPHPGPALEPHLAELLEAVAEGNDTVGALAGASPTAPSRPSRTSPSSSSGASSAATPEAATASSSRRVAATLGAMTTRRVPVVLSIAGSDSGGGAGIQADLKAFAAAGVHGTTAITAITVQNTVGVTGVHPVPTDDRRGAGARGGRGPRHRRREDRDARRRADDRGGRAGARRTARDTPVVLDPVMVAESGARLCHAAPRTRSPTLLLPRATVVTPNVPEARALTGLTRATATAEDLVRAVHRSARRSPSSPAGTARRRSTSSSTATRSPRSPASATPTAPRMAAAARTRARSPHGSRSATTRSKRPATPRASRRRRSATA